MPSVFVFNKGTDQPAQSDLIGLLESIMARHAKSEITIFS